MEAKGKTSAETDALLTKLDDFRKLPLAAAICAQGGLAMYSPNTPKPLSGGSASLDALAPGTPVGRVPRTAGPRVPSKLRQQGSLAASQYADILREKQQQQQQQQQRQQQHQQQQQEQPDQRVAAPSVTATRATTDGAFRSIGKRRGVLFRGAICFSVSSIAGAVIDLLLTCGSSCTGAQLVAPTVGAFLCSLPIPYVLHRTLRTGASVGHPHRQEAADAAARRPATPPKLGGHGSAPAAARPLRLDPPSE